MANKKHLSLWRALDWWTIGLYILLVLFGWVSICGATYTLDIEELFTAGSRPLMQAIWIVSSILVAFLVVKTNPKVYQDNAYIAYSLMLLVCLVTIFIAPNIKGSRSWLVIGPLRVQPAEFMKVATSLMLAWQCSKFEFELLSTKGYWTVISIISIPILLILAQQETGSALVFFALFLPLYREGFTGLLLGLTALAVFYFVATLMLQDTVWWGATSSGSFLVANVIGLVTLSFLGLYGRSADIPLFKFFALGVASQILGIFISLYLSPFDLFWLVLGLLIALVIYTVWLFIRRSKRQYIFIALFAIGSLGFVYSTDYIFDKILQPHQQVRIRIALGIEEDLRGKGYNVDQSKIAIGSGGLWGKGLLQGTQTKLNYVPEQDTDFIFCTVGEELGFAGSSLLLILYGSFILRLCHLAERQRTVFARVYGYSVSAILLFHLFVNVGMVLGIVPVIGIPLPFFSYGGSSLWGFTLMLFIFLGLDARRYNRNL